MKHSSSTYFVQSKDENGKLGIVGHSQDEETGEIYFKFLDKKKATKLLEEEKKSAPQLKYRIIKETTTFEEGTWS